MTNQEYDKFLAEVSTRVYNLRNYRSFFQYENDWLNYYKNIFLPNLDINLPPRIFIAESAPDGIYGINPNYIFSITTLNNYLSYKTDMYLYRYFRGVFPNYTPSQTTLLTKKQVLMKLSTQNILIIDLLPTHGIKLQTDDRVAINKKLVSSVDFTFLNNLNFQCHKINYAFSIPPSLYTQNFCAKFLKNNFIEFGNVNTGQGHAPSIAAISQIIKDGF
jgi:hypothetical protein